MALQPVHADFTISWLAHDSWSETYVGVRRLAFEVLPDTSSRQNAEDGPLCQLALVGSNHLMEIALYKALHQHIPGPKLENASYYEMLELLKARSASLNLADEPFLSTERLRKRRNATVHKHSALATVEMARSALYSAVEGSRAVFAFAGASFPYGPHLVKFPPIPAPQFSAVPFPGGA
jgi:hypothetical protein